MSYDHGHTKPSGANRNKSSNCNMCGFYNYEYRTKCRECGTKIFRAEGDGKPSYSKGGSKPYIISAQWKMRTELKESKERIRELQEKLEAAANPKAESKGSEAEGNDMEDEAHTDARNIADLQKSYDQLVSLMNLDDKGTRDI